MLIRRAFKFELKPDGRQACQIGKFCGCARYVYNRTLSLEKSLYAKMTNTHSDMLKLPKGFRSGKINILSERLP